MKIPSIGNYLTEDNQTAIVDELSELVCSGRIANQHGRVTWSRMSGAYLPFLSGSEGLSIVSPAPIPWRERQRGCAREGGAVGRGHQGKPLPRASGGPPGGFEGERHSMTTQPWLPISTAPQDGSWILLYDPSSLYKVYTGMWDESFSYSWPNGESIGAWTSLIAQCFAMEEYQQLLPTHWMPLPPAP